MQGMKATLSDVIQPLKTRVNVGKEKSQHEVATICIIFQGSIKAQRDLRWGLPKIILDIES